MSMYNNECKERIREKMADMTRMQKQGWNKQTNANNEEEDTSSIQRFLCILPPLSLLLA